MFDADSTTVVQNGDVIAMSGRREQLVNEMSAVAVEVEDHDLLDAPAEVVDGSQLRFTWASRISTE